MYLINFNFNQQNSFFKEEDSIFICENYLKIDSTILKIYIYDNQKRFLKKN